MDEQNNNSLVEPLFDVPPFSWPQAEKDRYYDAANQSKVQMKICSDFLKSKQQPNSYILYSDFSNY